MFKACDGDDGDNENAFEFDDHDDGVEFDDQDEGWALQTIWFQQIPTLAHPERKRTSPKQ